MASFGQTFDASSIEPSSGYDVLPPGKYLAQIVASEMRATKDGLGQYLYLEVDVIEGQYAGRKLFDRLNLINANADAVQIAQRTLSSICRAVGKLQVGNSEQLHLIPLIADVRVRPPKGMYGESNSVRYLPRGGQAANAPTFSSGQSASASCHGYGNACCQRTALEASGLRSQCTNTSHCIKVRPSRCTCRTLRRAVENGWRRCKARLLPSVFRSPRQISGGSRRRRRLMLPGSTAPKPRCA